MQRSVSELDRSQQAVEGFRRPQSVVSGSGQAAVQVTDVSVCLDRHVKHWKMQRGDFETHCEHLYSSVHSV